LEWREEHYCYKPIAHANPPQPVSPVYPTHLDPWSAMLSQVGLRDTEDDIEWVEWPRWQLTQQANNEEEKAEVEVSM